MELLQGSNRGAVKREKMRKSVVTGMAALCCCVCFNALASDGTAPADTSSSCGVGECCHARQPRDESAPEAGCCSARPQREARLQRLTVGGYGEVALGRNFYSDNVYRYSSASSHKGEEHGRFDIPHAVVYLGYDFGKGWSMQSEIEFEHLGTGTEVEQEFEEAGEWENEIERGGEVELEQFWLQKSFLPQLNVRMGHLVVPVGGLNNRHEPLNFFTVYRPEGEYTVLPSTWHDTGISVWGQAGSWRYEVLLVSGLDAMLYSRDNFIKNGAHTPFDFQVANHPGVALRVDKSFRCGLDVGVSGYYSDAFGNTFPNDKPSVSYMNGVTGSTYVAALDFRYISGSWVVRGNADYGHVSDARALSRYKSSKGAADGSPYSDTPVGDEAYAVGIEAGYDLFSIIPVRDREQKCYLFARYERYDPYVANSGQGTYNFTRKDRIAAGVNWYPIPQIAVKAEYSYRFLRAGYNDEPSINIGIAYMGFFQH